MTQMIVTMLSARNVEGNKMAFLKAHGTRDDLPFTQRLWQPAITALLPRDHADSWGL